MSIQSSSRFTVSGTSTGTGITLPVTAPVGDEIHSTVDPTRTKGYIFENDSEKVFHVVGWKAEYQAAAFENAFAVDTVLAPGSEHRWEMLYRGRIRPSTYRAWVTYATKDGTEITVGMEGDYGNDGRVCSVSIRSATPITCEIGEKDSAHLIMIMS